MASSFEISSHVRDLIQMHQNLQTQLSSCQTLCDLSPFIEMLFDQTKLKKQLSKLLEQQFEQERITNPSSSNKIRSLYIQTNQMQLIPSMDVQAHILSYLSSNDFHQIHLVSKHLNQIMNEYAHIYNDNHYILQIKDCMSDTSIGWKSRISHQHSTCIVYRVSDNAASSNQSIPKPFNQIKRWKVFEMGSEHILNALQSNADHIHSLDLECSPLMTCRLLQSVSFPNCKVLITNHYIECTPTFSALQYLDLKLSTANADHLLEYLPKCVIFLSLNLCNRAGTTRLTREVVKIPSTVQWLRTYGDDTILYNLNECQQLFGWSVSAIILDAMLQNTFFWPIRYVIPYVQITKNAFSHTDIDVYTKQTFPALLIYLRWEFCGFKWNFNQSKVGMTLSQVQNKLNTFNTEERLVDPKARWFMMNLARSMDYDHEDCNYGSVSRFTSMMELLIADETDRNKITVNLLQMIKLSDCGWMRNMLNVTTL
eukprot:203703_1